MARYVDAIDLPVPIEEAFDYLADFSRTAEWDPGVKASSRLTGGEIGPGSRFQVVVSVFGQQIPLEYRITEFDRPTRLVLEGGDSSLRSIDEITFVSRPGGTRVSYEARIELVGIRRLAEPILDALFQRIGRLAVRGLRERLSETAATDEPRSTPPEPKVPARRGQHPKSGRSRGSSRAARSQGQSGKEKGVAS